jgi:hypothetical protein
MNRLHPAYPPILALALTAGRVVLDLTAPAAAEAWQRGVEVLAAAAMVGVVVKFSPGDPPRRPWALMMVLILLVVAARLAAWFGVEFGDIKLVHLFFIVANLCVAAAMIGFNRMLGSSELLSERTADDRWRALGVVGLLAVLSIAALTANTFGVAERGVPATAGAWVAATSTFVSTLCDAIVCAGGVYLVWLVRPMIGGSLARPYLLLAVSGGCFLVVDFLLVAAGATTQTELAQTNLLDHAARWLGCLAYALTGLAGATQLWLLRSAGRRSASSKSSAAINISPGG